MRVYWYKVTDSHGEISQDVVVETNNWICVNGIDSNNNYQQFDSCEAYHVYAWADRHGFKVEMKEKLINWE